MSRYALLVASPRTITPSPEAGQGWRALPGRTWLKFVQRTRNYVPRFWIREGRSEAFFFPH